MFFLFICILIFLLVAIALYTSKIGIEVQNLKIDTEKKTIINEDYDIYLFFLIFWRVKIFKKSVKNLKIKNVKLQQRDIDIKLFKNRDFKINYKELIQSIRLEIENIDLYVQIGTENAAFTAILIGVISAIVGVILKKPKYEIVPAYKNKNLLKVELNCIITVYLMHYIYNEIFKLLKRKR